MGADFLRPGAETVVMSVDNSADLFTAVVEEQSDGAVRFEWAEGEGPVFPPRQGALVRLLEGAGTGRAYSWDAEVRERGGNHLLCDLVGQPQPYERRGYKRVRTMLPLRFSIQSPQTGPADVMQRLERLEKTVQRIAKHVGIPDPLGERPVGLREVCELSLSGGGAGLILDYHMTIGERL